MYGAILGDIVGSPFEFDMGDKSKEFQLFSKKSEFTDDSVMTLAIYKGIMEAESSDDESIKTSMVCAMRELGRNYPNAGYGLRFSRWLDADEPQPPYHSYGNGSAMRVSCVGWMYETLDEVRHMVRLTAEVTHNHPEGIAGAEAVASAIFLARRGKSKGEIKEYIEMTFDYDLSRTCDEIRPTYSHVESCRETVPEAITAFLKGESFEDVIRTAVSLGGDCDTLTAIAGSIAEAYYGIDEDWKKAAYFYLTADLSLLLRDFDVRFGDYPLYRIDPVHEAIVFAAHAHNGQKRKGTDIDYITHPLEVLQILTSMNAGRELQAAGVLHDTVEDSGVSITEIQRIFGGRVAALVESHSEDKTKSWQERKQQTLDDLTEAERDVKLLVMADAVANLRSMVSDYAQIGEKLWERFNVSKQQKGKYYSDMQDLMFELQHDSEAKLIYWEFVDLYKDLFVDFLVDEQQGEIYQKACGTATHVFRKKEGDWERFRGEVPETAVRYPRVKAERLEDLWRGMRRKSLSGASYIPRRNI